MKSFKNLALFGMVLSLSISAFASTERASGQEKQLLCTAIEKMLENESADMAVDMDRCLSNKRIKSKLQHETFRTVTGQVKMRSPNRSFYLTCSTTYSGTAELSSIVGGIEGGVSCSAE